MDEGSTPSISTLGQKIRPFQRIFCFLQKYNISTTANSQRLLESLVDKELILANSTIEGVSYSVYNVFLSRWLENQ